MMELNMMIDFDKKPYLASLGARENTLTVGHLYLKAVLKIGILQREFNHQAK